VRWLSLFVAAGCGGGDRIPVAPVSGIVLYNGVPAKDVCVTFSKKGSPIVAAGTTDDEGWFELTSVEAGDGAPVGDNQVTIFDFARPGAEASELQNKVEEASAIKDPIERAQKLKEARQHAKAARAAAGQAKSRIPVRYANPDTSKLLFTVEAGVDNQCEFNLTD
jgi:hypothetical protein